VVNYKRGNRMLRTSLYSVKKGELRLVDTGSYYRWPQNRWHGWSKGSKRDY